MASACVNQITMSPEKFLNGPSNFPWLSPPASKNPDLDISPDFEFLINDPVNILPADELFSNGKLMALSDLRLETKSSATTKTSAPEKIKSCRKIENVNTDPYLFSPKAPRCSSRWKDLLGLKRLNINGNAKTSSSVPTRNSTNSCSGSSNSSSTKFPKMFLHRTSKSTGSSLEASLNLPLLPDSDFVTSARLSLSSSSSGGYDYDADLPRHSLDSDRFRNGSQNMPRIRLARHRTASSENPVPTRMGWISMRKSLDLNDGTVRGISVDSPRMNASGRVIFQGLERSSSSPSSFNGGPKLKYKGMERSYSANVRVAPVLNVGVCSLMGSSKSSVFGFQIFPNNNTQKSGGSGGGSRGHVTKIRTEKS